MRGGRWVLPALVGLLIACGRSVLGDYTAASPDAVPQPAPFDQAGRRAPAQVPPGPATRAGARAPEPPPIGAAGAKAPEPTPPPPVIKPDPPSVPTGKTRTILDGEIENARDLGGIPLGPGRMVAYGELFRGPPLAGLSADGCAEVERLGIRTVVDLRIDSERASKPEAECVQRSAQLVAAPLPVPYDLSPAAYLEDLNTTDSIATVFDALGDPAAYPIYFHCTWGRDRTGVLAAVILLALGASPDDIMQEYLLSRATVGAYPMSLAAVFDEIERRGGIEAYLDRAGISDAQREALRAQAVQ